MNALSNRRRAAVPRCAGLVGLLALWSLGANDHATAQSLDEDVFAAQVPPNVVLFVDNSGSMDNIIEHPSYDSATAVISCNPFSNVPSSTAPWSPYFAWYPDDNGDTILTYCWDDQPASCFFLPDIYHAGYTYSSTSADHPLSGYVTREFCGNEVNIWHDGFAEDNVSYSYYPGTYAAWLFSQDRSDNSTLVGPAGSQMTPKQILDDIDDSTNGRDFITGTYYGKYQRVRITSARNIASDVIYRTNTDCPAYTPSCTTAEDRVRFGLAIFDGGSEGGYIKVPVDDYATNRSDLESSIGALQSQTLTPLAETLFKIYTYFMARPLADRPYGAGSPATRFPSYSYRTSDGAHVGSAVAPASPVTEECQQNFVIMITDGAPTDDTFNDTTSSQAQGFTNFTNLVGDYFADAVGDPDTPETAGPWGSGSGYLDDVADFMQRNDFRPDYPNTTNTIDVYTVGFTTEGVVNDLLRKTASNGNGLFFTGNQSETLTEALVSSVQDIISKSQGFSAATVPAARTSDGGNIYTSLFQPSSDRPFWPGLLRSYKITARGEIFDKNGACALENLADPTLCAGGTFKDETAAPPFWNASSKMPAPNSRRLRVSIHNGSTQKMVTFDHSITGTQLGMSAAIAADFPPAATITAASDLDEAVRAFIAGCEWGTGMFAAGSDDFSGCTSRTIVSNGNTVPDRLGDIFHSNPVVVGPPSSFIEEVSYGDFATQTNLIHRERLIFAGANDGFMHAFNAGNYLTATQKYDEGTGIEKFAFMPWGVRAKVQDLAKSSSTLHPITVDGSPSVADVWIDSNSDPQDAKVASEWMTILISGLREGGNHYFALDITDPAATGYPGFLWSFPDEVDTTWSPYMGQTWSQPVITRVRVKNGSDDVFEKWVAVIGFGYDPTSDPNKLGPAGYDATSIKGRGVAMIDVATGLPLAVRKVGTGTGDVSDMHYAFASQPGVLDADQDGFADLIYIGDLGGNLWKWVVKQNGIAEPTAAELYQPDWSFRKFFSTDPSRNQGDRARSFFFAPAATIVNSILHLGLGTGERANLNCDSTTDGCTLANRYYVLKDRDMWDSGSPTTIDGRGAPTGDLTDVTLFKDACPSVAYDGFFFTLAGDGEKFVTNSEVFNAFFFSSTFKPDTANACDPTGDSLLYGFLAKCGQGFFGPPSATSPIANTERAMDVGSGIPTDARLSIAPGDGGNRLIISKQDGELVNIDSGSSSSEHGVMYWRELD